MVIPKSFVPDKNFWCRICGKKETIEPHQKHHIIPKSLGGQDLFNGSSNRIILCKTCHEIIHFYYPVILWKYISESDKELARKDIINYVKSKVRYNYDSETIS